MSSKPYTTLQRLTIEALDCVIKPPKYDSQGHVQIFIEPRIPVESVHRNADPLLSQTTGQQNDTSSATAVSSTSPTSELPATITSQTDTTVPNLEDTMTSPTITSPYSLSGDTDIAQYFSTLGDDIETVTPVPDDDDIETVTPVPDDKVSENNDTPNDPSTLPLQQNTKQTQTVEDNFDLDMSEYMKCSRFQEKLKSVKTKLSKEFSHTTAKHPGHIRNLILQILKTYPDILDDRLGPILEYVETDVGNIPIIQPLYEDISEPDTTQNNSDHQEDDIQQVESESDDCIIQKVIPPPEKIDQPEAPPLETPPPGLPATKAQLKFFPDGTVPHILLQLPYGTQDNFYPHTTINDIQIMKRHRPRDNSPQPSTSTGTYTKSGSSKHKKHKKKNRKDKS